jgi:tyrosine-specific transport protein
MPRLGGQVLLVAGSAVGAGLLALPAVTYASGFVPSCATLVAVWAYMGATALLLVEAAARDHRPRPNLLGMAQANLGTGGRVICFALYVLIYAATITAYISEGGRQAVTILKVVLECLGTDFTMVRPCLPRCCRPSRCCCCC